MMMDTYQTERNKSPMCWNCSGQGKHMGGGMLSVDCKVCNGEGFINPEKLAHINAKLDKRSKAYKEAIAAFMTKSPELTKAAAEELFEAEYNKLS